jgi:hypothetical protein
VFSFVCQVRLKPGVGIQLELCAPEFDTGRRDGCAAVEDHFGRDVAAEESEQAGRHAVRADVRYHGVDAVDTLLRAYR